MLAWRGIRLAVAALLLPLLLACPTRPVEKPLVGEIRQPVQFFPQVPEKDVDLLFVIDNSNSMGEEQEKLYKQFAKLIDGLRNPKLGQDRTDGPPCSDSDRSNCKIPNVRIGVVSSDLGAGNYSLPSCETAGGDGGRLQNRPRAAACTPPRDPWISYVDGVTNIPGAGVDPIEQVKQAFTCIAALGTGGCGFEHQLESARRALDPTLNVNPGFLRPDAYLAVVFITDEDDCSAQKPQLFDPAQQGLGDPLGPLTSFRCTEFGVHCDKDGRQAGPRHSCTPGFDWLRKVEDYQKFFRGLKPNDRTLLFAIAGPLGPFEVGLEGPSPTLKPSCVSLGTAAVPAVRIASVVNAMGPKRGAFNRGVDASGNEIDVSICAPDYGPALKLIGDVIVNVTSNQCLGAPPLLRSGGLACAAGDPLGPGVTCKESCLDRVDCVVEEIAPSGSSRPVDRCPADLFSPTVKSCGASCDCWRIVPRADCNAKNGAPYALEILRVGNKEPAKGTMAKLSCAGSLYTWGSAEFAALPQCR